jgi:hypothetical protein
VSTFATQTQTFIPVCCVCGLAREEGDSSGTSTESWSEFEEYLTRHGLHGAEYRLTHAYCPVCVRQYVPTKKKTAPGNLQVTASKADIVTVILRAVREQNRCDLDALARACPQFTWNQIFLEVDRLSRTGELYLTLSGPCHYAVSLPEHRSGMNGRV